MGLGNLVYCIGCGHEFDDWKCKPCLGSCSHSVCADCQREFTGNPEKQCPVCHQPGAFAKTTVNWIGGQLLSSDSERRGTELYEVVDKIKKNEQGVCSECHVFTKQLHFCTTCARSSRFLTNGSNGSWHFESGNRRILGGGEMMFDAKRRSVCSECFLERHEGHEGRVKMQVIERLSESPLLKYRLMRGERLEHIAQLTATENDADRLMVRFRGLVEKYELWSKMDSPREMEKWMTMEMKRKEEWKTAWEQLRRNEQLRGALLKCQMEHLESWMKHSTPTVSQELKVLHGKMSALAEHPKFRNFKLELDREERVSIFSNLKEEIQMVRMIVNTTVDHFLRFTEQVNCLPLLVYCSSKVLECHLKKIRCFPDVPELTYQEKAHSRLLDDVDDGDNWEDLDLFAIWSLCSPSKEPFWN